MHHLLAGEPDPTFSFEVAFPLLIKRTMGSQTHVQRQDIALEAYNGTRPGQDPMALQGTHVTRTQHRRGGSVDLTSPGTAELPVVSAQQMGENHCRLAAASGSLPC